MNEERRKALDIPIHKSDKEHTFVDGYCICGAAQVPRQRYRHVPPLQGRRTGKMNLDIVEQNLEELR